MMGSMGTWAVNKAVPKLTTANMVIQNFQSYLTESKDNNGLDDDDAMEEMNLVASVVALFAARCTYTKELCFGYPQITVRVCVCKREREKA
jgi:hypothetical protein